MKKIDISIIVSIYNKKQSTLDVIDKLFFPSLINNASTNKELIIIDDCSPLKKETRILIKKYEKRLIKKFGNYKFIENSNNLGFAGSYNKGLKIASGKTVILTNDDVYFPLNSINELNRLLRSNKNFGAVIPVTNSAYGSHNTLLLNRLKSLSNKEVEKIELFSKWLKKVMKNQYFLAKMTDNLTGFCIVADKNFLDKIGYFDTRYKYGMVEDTDLFKRILLDKKEIIISLGIFVEHGGIGGGSSSILQHPYKAIKNYISNSIKYIAKWGSFIEFPFNMLLSLIRFYDLGFTVTKRIKKQAIKKGLWDEYLRTFKNQK